jgi:two-component system response regulator AtoC
LPKVLIVDDDPAVLFALSELMEASGTAALTAASGEEALERLDGVDVVVTDLAMPGMNGLALLNEIHAREPGLPVILITAHGSERIAVDALKRGAYDYIAKPFDNDELSYSIRRAAETRALRRKAQRLSFEESHGVRLVGDSPAFQRALATAVRLADKDVTVLIRGETGTGKELFGTILHARSRRVGKPLVKFNCAAIPEDLAEAQLFGHVKGAFTGATGAHSGYFVQAHGGTLVLDEIGELSLAVQAKLLRVLQEGEVQPLGSARVEKVDVRVIASTHRDLAAEVKASRFREDLYYRIAVVELLVPPLRERPGDVALLAREFARKLADGRHPEAAARALRIEQAALSDQRLDVGQALAERARQLQRQARGHHPAATAHEQVIVEHAAQPRQRPADRRLGQPQTPGGRGDAPLVDERLQRGEEVQVRARHML